MKWSQAVCASILVEGLYPPANKVRWPGAAGPEGRFQEAYLMFGTYAPDDRFRPHTGAIDEPSSLADSHRV